jgi:hypothetical protein
MHLGKFIGGRLEMDDLSFFAPVCVKTGDSVQVIESVGDALRFLHEWPLERRGSAFRCAFRSAEAAIAGQLSVEQAQHAFARFAGVIGILSMSNRWKGLGCPACGSLSVDLPEELESSTVVHCDRCGHSLGAWGDLQKKFTQVVQGAFELDEGRIKPID